MSHADESLERHPVQTWAATDKLRVWRSGVLVAEFGPAQLPALIEGAASILRRTEDERK